MLLSLIVARSKNGVIGKENGLPWHLPNDLKYFRKVTMGKPVIMGRKTWESIGRPLPGRKNIVITRQPGYKAAEGVDVVTSLEQALAVARQQLDQSGVTEAASAEAVIIGGEQLYRLALDQVTKIYITEVHAKIDGDAFFPDVDLSDWQKTSQQDFAACEKNPYPYSFLVYERESLHKN